MAEFFSSPATNSRRHHGVFGQPVKGKHLEIKNELFRIASQPIGQIPSFPIVINVRLGRDFKKPNSAEDFLKLGGVRTPIQWYVNALDVIRSEVGEKTLPAIVVSDGKNSELAPLLRKNNVSRYISHHAIQDLMVLSQAKHIIGTGGSSFTAWGCFLSQANVVTVVGQSMNWFGLSEASAGSIRTLGFDDYLKVDDSVAVLNKIDLNKSFWH